MSTRRKTQYNAKDVARQRMEDLHMEQSLQSMQSRAQKEEKPIQSHTKNVRTSRVATY